jgi:SNF2 family DNA or RNA helicase
MQWYVSPVPWKPHAGQKKAVKFLLEHACAGLFADPGVGKTSTVLAAFSYLKKRGLVNKMLVVAPLRPMSLVWPKELAKWRDFKHLRMEILHGKDKDTALLRECDIAVINYEGLPWLFDTTVTVSPQGKNKAVSINAAKFQKYGFDVLVCDELSKVKHTQSITHKTLKPALQFFSRRWGLTGSPAPNGLSDLFGQCYVLDMGRTFGQFVTHFRSEYCTPSEDGYSFVVRPEMEKEIYKRIKPLVLRLAAEDYVDMPLLVEHPVKFELPKNVRKIYDEVEADLFSRIDSGVVVAANAAAASSKCRQIVSGGVYLDDTTERKWENLHDLKTDLLEDLIDELQGEPILVAYEFLHDLDRILKRFGKNTPYIGGGVTPKRATEIEHLWNTGKIPLLAVHPRSAGHGLNLQGAGAHVAWYSLTYDYELFLQLIGRIRRQGQRAKRVFCHALMAEKSIDDAVWWALHCKERGQNALFAALQQRRKG